MQCSAESSDGEASGRLTPSTAAHLVPALTAAQSIQPRPTFTAPPSRILPDLYLGDHGTSVNYKQLINLNITHVLNVKGGFRVPPSPYKEQLTIVSVPLSDFGDDVLSSKLAECFAVLDAAHSVGGSCLVHCSQGMNRSPSIVLCYLMCNPRLHWSLREAWTHVKGRRPMVSPHHLYWAQLEALECEVHGIHEASLHAQEAGIYIPAAVLDDERLQAQSHEQSHEESIALTERDSVLE